MNSGSSLRKSGIGLQAHLTTSTLLLGGSGLFWRDAKRRNLAAAAGYVSQAGGAKTRQISGEFSAEKIRRKIHQHVAELHISTCGNVRENFAADGDAFLHDPATTVVFGAGTRNRRLDRGVPLAFAGFPAERDSRATIFVARFQNQVLAFFAHELEQIDGFAVVRRAHIRDHTRPGNMLCDDLALRWRKQRIVS